jgi:translation initiation factor 2 alpha subunit (eIF-2alpha)
VLAERAGDLLLHRLEEIFERGALVHLDEHLGLHACDQVQVFRIR